MLSTDSNSEDIADKAFAELFALFAKPTKSHLKSYRTYELSFENGEPVFKVCEVDRIVEEAFKETPSTPW